MTARFTDIFPDTKPAPLLSCGDAFLGTAYSLVRRERGSDLSHPKKLTLLTDVFSIFPLGTAECRQ